MNGSILYMISAFIGLVLFVICVMRPQTGRVILSVLFIAAALLNAISVLSVQQWYIIDNGTGARNLYTDMVNFFWGKYMTESLLATAACQLMIGLLLCMPGVAQKIGLAGAIVFLIVLVRLQPGFILPGAFLLIAACIALIPRRNPGTWGAALHRHGHGNAGI